MARRVGHSGGEAFDALNALLSDRGRQLLPAFKSDLAGIVESYKQSSLAVSAETTRVLGILSRGSGKAFGATADALKKVGFELAGVIARAAEQAKALSELLKEITAEELEGLDTADKRNKLALIQEQAMKALLAAVDAGDIDGGSSRSWQPT